MKIVMMLLFVICFANSVFAEVITQSQAKEIFAGVAVEIVESSPSVFVVEPQKVQASDGAAERAWVEEVNRTLSSANVVKKDNIFEEIKRMVVKSDVHIFAGLGLSFDNNWNTLGQPIGFATESSDSNKVSPEFSIIGKYKCAGFEVIPFNSGRDLPTEFYGSGLGKVRVTRDLWLVGRIYPVENSKYSLFVGFGVEHNKVSGNLSMAGFLIPVKRGGYTPIVQFGGQYHLNKSLSLEGGYNKRNVPCTSELPGVPDITPRLESSYFARLLYRGF